jgi:DNA repair protein RecN (Recombination protein N)
MLTSLKIKNYALLKDIEIVFSGGLNILTGETGAGKSIIIGAINTAIGERGYVENIRTGEEKAVVEAVFDLKDSAPLKELLNPMFEEAGLDRLEDTLIIRREINRASKGKISINNSNATLAFLERVGKLLVDIHGQHEHQSLLKNEIHMDLLDDYAGNGPARAEIGSMFSSVNELNNEIKRLKALEDEKQEKLEMIAFRLGELEQANPGADTELDDLNSERQLMIHTESIKDSVNKIIVSLQPASVDAEGDGAIDLLFKAIQEIEEIGKIDKKSAEAQLELAKDAGVKLEEIKEFFVGYRDRVEFDKEKLNETEERISLLEGLIKKYRKDGVRGLKLYFEELKEEKKKIELNSDIIKEKEKEKSAALEALAEKCSALSAARHKAAGELGSRIEEELKDLGIGKGRFLVDVRDTVSEIGDTALCVKIGGKNFRVTALGINEAEFMISLNPGEDLKPLVKVASGGEISRIMLSIKNILSAVDRIPVMVFDEIDTGISGKIARVVGKKLKEISGKKQLLCITHLPQIAAYSDTHYSVEKQVVAGKTETRIIRLDDKDKLNEVAKLLSGEKVTDASLEAARELILNIKND